MKYLTIIAAITLYSCGAIYGNHKTDNTISAPILTVWNAAVAELQYQNIKIYKTNQKQWLIKAKRGITAYSNSDIIEIQLLNLAPNKTELIIKATAALQLIGWGEQKRLANQLFKNIETRAYSPQQSPPSTSSNTKHPMRSHFTHSNRILDSINSTADNPVRAHNSLNNTTTHLVNGVITASGSSGSRKL